MANAPEDAHLDSDNMSLSDSAEALVAPATPTRHSNSRAMKVAGLTTLACLLLVSQVFTLYMVIDQSKQISTLKKKSDEVNKQLARSFQGLKSAPVKLQLPVNNIPLVMDIEMPEQKAQLPAANPVSLMKTKCQIEAEPGHGKLGTYQPQCDEQGHYKSMQCWRSTGFCWCVDETGTVIEGTTMRGQPACQRGQALGYTPDAITTTNDLDGK